jgi:hypothetical protein
MTQPTKLVAGMQMIGDLYELEPTRSGFQDYDRASVAHGLPIGRGMLILRAPLLDAKSNPLTTIKKSDRLGELYVDKYVANPDGSYGRAWRVVFGDVFFEDVNDVGDVKIQFNYKSRRMG